MGHVNFCRGCRLIEAVRWHGGRVVTDIDRRRIDAIRIRDIVDNATAVDEEVAHEDRGLEIVVGEATAIGGDLVTVGGVIECMTVQTI